MGQAEGLIHSKATKAPTTAYLDGKYVAVQPRVRSGQVGSGFVRVRRMEGGLKVRRSCLPCSFMKDVLDARPRCSQFCEKVSYTPGAITDRSYKPDQATICGEATFHTPP